MDCYIDSVMDFYTWVTDCYTWVMDCDGLLHLGVPLSRCYIYMDLYT